MQQFHYDAYMDLSIVDGYRVTLSTKPAASEKKLFYVHLGGYDPEEFTELHKNFFLVAPDQVTAKSRARESWKTIKVPHKDVQFDLESCLHVDEVDRLYINLEPTNQEPIRDLHLGYNLIPKEIIAKCVEN